MTQENYFSSSSTNISNNNTEIEFQIIKNHKPEWMEYYEEGIKNLEEAREICKKIEILLKFT